MGDTPSPRPAADSSDQQPRATRAQLRAVGTLIKGLVELHGGEVVLSSRDPGPGRRSS